MHRSFSAALLGLFLLGVISCGLQAALPPESDDLVPLKILHTGNTQSALEVCGCRDDMHGGVAPRGHIIAAERQGVERFLLLDSGGLFAGSEAIDRERIQLYLQMMTLMNYDAILVSETEFCFGADFLIEQLQIAQLPAVATNLSAPDDFPLPWQPVLNFEFPRLRVAVIGLMKEDPALIPAPYAVTNPIEAASRAIQEIGDSAEMIIALSTLDNDQERELLKEVPAIDLLLSGQGGLPFQRYFGVLTAHSSDVGKSLNVVEVCYYPLAEQLPFSFRPRSRIVHPDQGVDPILRQVVDDFYASFREQALAEVPDPRLFAQEAVETLPDNAFVGSAACQDCHQDKYEHWRHTRHASSMLSLLNKQRHFVPRCLTCHTTGYGYPSGLNQFAYDSPFAHVGCESCHGPGALHIQQTVRKDAIRREVPDKHCKVCHDQDNDPDFDAKAGERRQAIQHFKIDFAP